MCLGVPGRVVDLHEDDGISMARVDFGGVLRRVCIEHVKDAKPGEWVLVHVGFALTRIDEEEAKRVFALLKELDQLDEVGA